MYYKMTITIRSLIRSIETCIFRQTYGMNFCAKFVNLIPRLKVCCRGFAIVGPYYIVLTETA